MAEHASPFCVIERRRHMNIEAAGSPLFFSFLPIHSISYPSIIPLEKPARKQILNYA
jgi:hypothetical protein